MVRFYIKHVERKPDPEPVPVKPKIAIVVGLILWTVALLALLAAPQSFPFEEPLALYTCIVGIVLGVYAFWHVRRR